MPHPEARYTVFESAAGFVALGWNIRGVVSLRLPDGTMREAERALLRHHPEALRSEPDGSIADVIVAIQRYFAGERVDFSDVPVDLGEQDAFFTRIYAAVRALGYGETTTYGTLAKALGAGPEAARDVGQAMARNPVPLIVPCHRVTAAGGKVGGFSAPGGAASKARMLALEGVTMAEAMPIKPALTQVAFDF